MAPFFESIVLQPAQIHGLGELGLWVPKPLAATRFPSSFCVRGHIGRSEKQARALLRRRAAGRRVFPLSAELALMLDDRDLVRFPAVRAAEAKRGGEPAETGVIMGPGQSAPAAIQRR